MSKANVEKVKKWELDLSQVEVTKNDLTFGTTRLLPPWDLIPKDFKVGNIFTKAAESIFFRDKIPSVSFELVDGIDVDVMRDCVIAHLASWEPKHQHKIAGVGYLMSKLIIVSEPDVSAT